MSASAPAGSASSISGMLSAASTSATSEGEDESDVISQPAPTSCIQVPTLETMVAIQRLRKSPLRRGLQADVASPDGLCPASSTDSGGVIRDPRGGLYPSRSPDALRPRGARGATTLPAFARRRISASRTGFR